MSLHGLLPYQVEEVIGEAQRHFKNWPAEHKTKLWEWLQLIFLRWKEEHGERSPGRGILLWTPADFTTAAPYECAGIGISNNIDLAFKLWSDKYAPFLQAVEKVTAPKIFAMLLLHETTEGADFRSITRARDLLHEYEKITLEATIETMVPYAQRGAKTLEAARKGHEAVHGSAEEKTQRYSEYQRAVNDLARDNPALSWDAICKKVGAKFAISGKTISRHTTKPNR